MRFRPSVSGHPSRETSTRRRELASSTGERATLVSHDEGWEKTPRRIPR